VSRKAALRTEGRKLTVGLVGQFIERHGLDRQELSVFMRPDTKLFFSVSGRASSNLAKIETRSWQQFATNRMLLQRYRVSERELRFLKHYFSASSLLPKEYIALLVLIRDISETTTEHASGGRQQRVSLVKLQAAIEYLLDAIKLARSRPRRPEFAIRTLFPRRPSTARKRTPNLDRDTHNGADMTFR